MSNLLRRLFFLGFVKPLVLVVLGRNVRNPERLPAKGPAILAANHNSHLDTMVLMTLFPWRVLRRVRPVAAADYFLRNRWIAWFALRIIGIVPVDRSGGMPRERLFDGVHEALLVPFFCDVFVGEPLSCTGSRESFMQRFTNAIQELAAAGQFAAWE